MLKTIGRFQVKSQLGGGGETVVFRAYDPEQEQDVAIKLIGGKFIDEAGLARLERDVQTLYDLGHPAIVPIEDLNELKGNPYLVTRYMEGGNLAARLTGGPLSLEDAVAILEHIAAALDAMHARGVIHADLSPTSVLFDAEGQPYLAGLGSLKTGDAATISPEEAAGDAPDQHSNIYSLGAILFHLLSGQPVNTAADQQGRRPPRLQALRPDLPAGVDAVVGQALAHDPAERFRSAADMIAALAETLQPGRIEEAAVDDLESTFASFLESLDDVSDEPDAEETLEAAPEPDPFDWEIGGDAEPGPDTADIDPESNDWLFPFGDEEAADEADPFAAEDDFQAENDFLTAEDDFDFLADTSYPGQSDHQPEEALPEQNDFLEESGFLVEDSFMEESEFLNESDGRDEADFLSERDSFIVSDVEPQSELEDVPVTPSPAPSLPPQRKRRIWPWLFGLLIFIFLAVAVVFLAWYVTTQRSAGQLPTPQAVLVVPSATPTAEPTTVPTEIPPTPEPTPVIESAITIHTAADGLAIDKGETVELRIIASDPLGVRSISLMSNGQSIGSYPLGGDLTIDIEHRWTPNTAGYQTVTANATNRGGDLLTAEAITLRVIDREMLERNAPIWARVESNVTSLRGLAALEPVEPFLLSRTALRQRFRASFDYSEEQAHRDVLVLASFDFLPRNFNLYEEARRYLGDNIAGYYNPETKEFVVASRNGEVSPLEQWVHAHEFMHALQDQHFQLQFQSEAGISFEKDMALRALAEGEAELLQELYLEQGYFSDEEIVELFNEASLQSSLGPRGTQSRLPPALTGAFYFAYDEGLTFVRTLYNRGGWEAVNNAWRNPPTSTEQIIHPQRYLNGDVPQTVHLASLAETLGPDWSLLAEDVFGEFFLREFLAQKLPDAEVDSAATGWGGDRYAVYWHETGEELISVYRIVWDTVADGTQFDAAYRRYANSSYGNRVEAVDGGGSCWLTVEVVCFYPGSAASLIVRGPDLTTAVTVAAAIGR